MIRNFSHSSLFVLALSTVAIADWNATTILSGSAVRPTQVVTSGTGLLKTTYVTRTNSLTFELSTQQLSADIQSATINLVPTGTDPVSGIGPVSVDIATLSGQIPPILGSASLFVFSAVTIQPTLAQLTAFNEQRAYVTVGTSNFGNGEIRGNIVPEPSSLVLTGLGVFGLVGAFLCRGKQQLKKMN